MDRIIKIHFENLISYHEHSADPEQEQSTFSYPTTDGMKNINSPLSDTSHPSNHLEQCRDRVEFIRSQIDSLEHYLPETYEMLMDELDQQQKALKQLEIQDFYQRQENAEQNKAINSTNKSQS